MEAVPANTVQICSIKVAVMEHFSWPLKVYGVIAARDAVDKRRNPLFLPPRDNFQLVHETVCILFFLYSFILVVC